MSAIYDANEYLIAGLENRAEWWEHLGDAHRDYAALAREAVALRDRAEAAEARCPEGYTVIQRGRVVISPEEAMARESIGERLSTADRWHGLDTSLVRSGDRLEEHKGQWIHMRRKPADSQEDKT